VTGAGVYVRTPPEPQPNCTSLLRVRGHVKLGRVTSREDLHWMIDALPDELLDEAAALLARLDDEPTTPAEPMPGTPPVVIVDEEDVAERTEEILAPNTETTETAWDAGRADDGGVVDVSDVLDALGPEDPDEPEAGTEEPPVGPAGPEAWPTEPAGKPGSATGDSGEPAATPDERLTGSEKPAVGTGEPTGPA
jgi:hypothetical protein